MGTRLKITSIIALFLVSSFTVTGQNSTASSRSSNVTSLSDFSETYKEKFETISKSIKERKSSTIAEKLALYENEISKLKEDFKTKRKAEYLSKNAKRAKRLTCVGTHTRNVTKCPVEFISAPNNNMYTKQEWIKIEDTTNNNNLNVSTDNSTVTLNMSANGKRTNKSVVYVTFKYKPENVPAIVDQEMTDFFSQLVIE